MEHKDWAGPVRGRRESSLHLHVSSSASSRHLACCAAPAMGCAAPAVEMCLCRAWQLCGDVHCLSTKVGGHLLGSVMGHVHIFF